MKAVYMWEWDDAPKEYQDILEKCNCNWVALVPKNHPLRWKFENTFDPDCLKKSIEVGECVVIGCYYTA